MYAVGQVDNSAIDDTEALGPDSESSRPTEPRSWSAPAPPMRDRLSTLELEELDELAGHKHFDFHDTIPAPPWLDGLGDADLVLPPLPPLPGP